MENKVSLEVTDEAISKGLENLREIEQRFAGLVSLLNDDRHNLTKMGDKSVAFVNKALQHALANPTVVPGYLSLEEFKKDVGAISSLIRLVKPMRQLLERLDDTMMCAGSEAMNAALVFYSAVKTAARNNEPGMKTVYEDLRYRYPGRPKGQSPNPSPVS